MPETQYKWRTPYHWLAEKVKTWSRERMIEEIINFAETLGLEISEVYHDEMSRDGFYDPISGNCPITKLHENDIVEILDTQWRVRQITFFDIHFVEITNRAFKRTLRFSLSHNGIPEKTVNLIRRTQ